MRRLEERLSDAKRDLPRAKEHERSRIEVEIEELNKEIAAQRQNIEDPAVAARKTEERIGNALKRERQPLVPVHPETSTKFINSPPCYCTDLVPES